jgi:MarR family transcriptional regulator, organic hydroperoxide resistance regulator
MVILRTLSILRMTAKSINSNDKQYQQVLAPHSMGYRIKLLSQFLGRNFQEQLEPLGVTPFHWVVLCCLWSEDGLATSAIGEKLQQVGGTLTGVLDRMEERGLIRRQRDMSDRRMVRIWLTDTGKKLKTVLPPTALDLQERVLADFSNSEREQFSQLLDRAIANLS